MLRFLADENFDGRILRGVQREYAEFAFGNQVVFLPLG